MNKLSNKPIVCTNVNIISMVDSNVSLNQNIYIRDGRIEKICDARHDHVTRDYFVVEGKGKYIMPALIDMHVHLGENKDDLLLYLVNGVTTIRNMWGYENFRLRNYLFGTRVFNHLLLRENIQKGMILGPSIITAGPMIEGDNSFFPKFMVERVNSISEAEKTVMTQAYRGYDLIKFYSTISEAVFDTLVRTAKANNIAIAGHVPDKVGIVHVVKAKVTSIEHLLGFFNPYDPALSIKESEVAAVAQMSAENGVYHCPTLIASDRICNTESLEKYKSEPELKYLPRRIRKGMELLQKVAHDQLKKKGLKPNHEYLPQLFRVIQELKQQGAQLIVGTDKGTPFVLAGFSIHHEMKLLHAAGLTPFEIMQAATINPAQCLHKENEIGTIEIGKRADLLLLSQNPFDNIDTIKNHCGVISGGVWLSREKCNDILKDLQDKNK